MALVNIREPIPYPARWFSADGLYASGAGGAMSSLAGTTLSVAGDVLHFVGRIQWDDGGTHTVAKIWFRTATVSNTNGVDLRVGFQTPTGANPRKGDDTFTHYGDLNSPISSNTTYSVSFSGPTLADGTEVCVTIDALNDSTPDSIAISTHNCGPTVQSAGVVKNSSKTVRLPSVVFESSGQTPHYGTFVSCMMWNEVVVASTSYNSGSAYDEYGMQFRMPFKAKTKEIYWYGRAGTSSVIEARLYKVGTSSPLASNEVQTYMSLDTALGGVCILPLGAEVTLDVDEDYIVSLKAMNTNNSFYAYCDSGITINASGNHASALPGGLNGKMVYRSGTGSWVVDSPRLAVYAGVLFSALDDGAGGTTSGIITHPGMVGGMRA